MTRGMMMSGRAMASTLLVYAFSVAEVVVESFWGSEVILTYVLVPPSDTWLQYLLVVAPALALTSVGVGLWVV